ncbi:transposase [Halorubrum sp. Atlit-26R]|uniref:transposase n=1 Tax=Halorubrum sp. Atlit-26R TaxID=2282128 RepID=UPI000EF26BEB|nr:transposase [Halorubrum sp. Atlit-26R]RLM67111.1 hypothetical protein DVK07_14165 [Halorubrum sp. Atlit-26R]
MTDHPPDDAVPVLEDSGGPYTTADISEHVSNTRQNQLSAALSQPDDCSGKSAELIEAIEQARAESYANRDSIADQLQYEVVDVVPQDDLINSSFNGMAMMRAYILKMISDDISGFDSLQWYLEQNPEIASGFGFEDGKVPNRTTFSTQWWERYRPAFREHVRFAAARIAAKLKSHDFNLVEDIDEQIHEFLPTEPEEDTEIPDEHQIEQQTRDRVFKEYRELFNEVIDYGRGTNKRIDAEKLTEQATFTSRRNESVTGGRDVYVSEHRVTDDDYMCSEALAKPLRNYSRKLAELNYARNNALVPGETSYDWSVNPEDRDFGEGESWHKRTEHGIDKQVEMLRERGMLDRPVDICIDGTAREYHNRNDTDVEEPDGVLHRYPKYETGYAYEDITLTAIYRGRAIVLASVSKVKSDEQYQCVRYLIDRACSLVNVNNVYADSEYGTQKICSYITHCGLDYVIKKRKTRGAVKEFLAEGAEGRADWTDYEIEGADHTMHKTTLLALEKITRSVTKKGEKRKAGETNDGTSQTTLPGMNGPDEEDDEGEGDGTEVEYAAFITSLDVEARGLHPSGTGARRAETTAFGVGQLYQKRWSIETAFRDIKQNFLANPRSRCLGVRRFFFMLCLLLYNCWVLLNLIVADEMDHRDNEEIIWRKKIFIIDIHNEVFPDIEFG